MSANKRYIKLIEIYLCVTLFLYYFGIWDFPHVNHLTFIMLVISYQTALYTGYSIGNKVAIRPGVRCHLPIVAFLRICFIVNIFMVLLNAIRMAGLLHFNIITLLVKFIGSFADFSLNYKAKFGITKANIFGGTTGTIILALWAFIGYAVIPLGFFYYKSLNRLDKTLFFINIAVTCISAIVIGTNKRIIDITLNTLLYFYMQYQRMSANNDLIYIKQRKRKRKKYIVIGTILAIGVMFLANEMVGSRGFGRYWNDASYRLGRQVRTNADSILLKIAPEFLHGFLAIVCSYFGQGYYGLSLTVDDGLLKFGVGLSSLWVVDNFDVNHLTLQYSAEQRYGWDSREMWHSAYTWIANDVGLIGTIFILFILGFIFALLIKEYKQRNSPIIFVLIYYFTLTFFFLPCNLQIFQDMYGYVGFWTFFLLWVISHLVVPKKRTHACRASLKTAL